MEARSAHAANALVSSVKDLAGAFKDNLPTFMDVEMCVASSDLDLAGGNLEGALQCISVDKLGLLIISSDDEIASTQESVFKRHITAMLRAGDEKKKPMEAGANLISFRQKVMEAHGEQPSLHSKVELEFVDLGRALHPESCTVAELEVSLQRVKQSEMLKALRVYECGCALLKDAGDAISKLNECRPDVEEYQAWVTASAQFMTSLQSCKTPEALANALQELKAVNAKLCSIVKKMRANDLLTKCIAAEVGDSFRDT